MEPRYVFIVGLPRTGTKLMLNVLENSQDQRWYITPEDFYLGRAFRSGVRQQMRKIGDMSLEANVHKLVEAMYAGQFFGEYWASLADGTLGVDKATMLQAILNSDRTDKGIYEVLLRVHADITGQTILGDKTGPHLYHVPTLLEWFPEAKVIHTFRDPRAVLASEHKKLLRQFQGRVQRAQKAGQLARVILLKLQEPFLPLFIVLYITTAWLYAVKLHYQYKKLYPNNYYLSKFEDLVNEPEKSLARLCGFLNIEFHPEMLNPPRVGSSYERQATPGFDQQTLTRWQDYLKPWMNGWLLLWGKKHLKEFGYIR